MMTFTKTFLKICQWILILTLGLGYAQNTKSLLWEISGKGLSKKSYVYGTMHVNDKVSYHLSDAFFKHLTESDIVANESDPETWHEADYVLNTFGETAPELFYNQFYMFPATQTGLLEQFSTQHNFFNRMLSGVDGQAADYQEGTVLDMFIRQVGKKYNKRAVGLENTLESMIPILKINEETAKPSEENIQKLYTLLQGKMFPVALKDYYREKDIVILDSIYKLMMSPKAHKALIVTRNYVMAHSIDSLAQQGSLFSAIGAAHLAGKEGVIQLLKNKGYTVTPIFDQLTEVGKKMKKTAEEYFPKPEWSNGQTSDQMIKMPLYKNFIENENHLGSADYTNGGVLQIKRLPLNYYLKSKDREFLPQTLDSLFYENIPGEILEKKYHAHANYFDIKNVTKTGNHQHYRFYITPLEIITVSMTGPLNYVRQYENDVFDKIQLKTPTSQWEPFTPQKGGFTLEIPAYNQINNNWERGSGITIQAFEPTEKAYYFLEEKTLNAFTLPEKSINEHKQIHYQFLFQHSADTLHTQQISLNKVQSESNLGDRKIRLQTVIDGSKYYLMGTVNASNAQTDHFFNSFKTENFTYTPSEAVYVDSLYQFSVTIPKKENARLLLGLDKPDTKLKNTIGSRQQTYKLKAHSEKVITLEIYQNNPYEFEIEPDSIKNYIKSWVVDTFDSNHSDEYSESESELSLLNPQNYLKKGLKKSKWDSQFAQKNEYNFENENFTADTNQQFYTYQAQIVTPNSNQALQYKAMLNNNTYYRLSTLIDKDGPVDPFVEKVFQSFTPDSIKTRTIPDKWKLFYKDIQQTNDTLRLSAFESIHHLDVTSENLDDVINFIQTFEFKSNEESAIETIIKKIGTLSNPKVVPFLEELYTKENTKSNIQIAILHALANQNTSNAYTKILQLMEYDLPLTNNNFDISFLFHQFAEYPDNSKILIPKIFQFYSINEYHLPILNFFNTLLQSKAISPKKLKPFIDMIVTNAKLEYKRLVSWKQNSQAQSVNYEVEDEDYYYNPTAPVEDLITYINLLYHFYDNNNVNQWFNKLNNMDIDSVSAELLRLGVLNQKITDTQLASYFTKPQLSFIALQLGLNNYPKSNWNLSNEEIAQTAVYNFYENNPKEIWELAHQQTAQYQNQTIRFFFFKFSKDGKNDFRPIVFLQNSETNVIDPQTYLALQTEEWKSDKETETEFFNRIIRKTIAPNNARSSFDKKDPNENPYAYLLNDY